MIEAFGGVYQYFCQKRVQVSFMHFHISRVRTKDILLFSEYTKLAIPCIASNFMQFLGKFGEIVCWRPRGVGTPSLVKSWICHWPAMKLGQGNIFRSVCQKFCSQGGSPGPHLGGSWGSGWGDISRPTPRGEVGEGPARGGCPGPHLGGLQAHTWGDVSQHALRQTLPPSSRWLLLWAVHILLECILV